MNFFLIGHIKDTGQSMMAQARDCNFYGPYVKLDTSFISINDVHMFFDKKKILIQLLEPICEIGRSPVATPFTWLSRVSSSNPAVVKQ